MRQYNIKPIEFYYKLIKFRSKLEAKYAIFFDFFNHKYIYEACRFYYDDNDLSKYYTPDFIVSHEMNYKPKVELIDFDKVWIIEIKPTLPNEIELKKALDTIVKYKYRDFCKKDFEFVFCIGEPFDGKYLSFKTESYIVDSGVYDLKHLEFVDDVFLKIKSLESKNKKINGYKGFYFNYKNEKIYCNEMGSNYQYFFDEVLFDYEYNKAKINNIIALCEDGFMNVKTLS